VVAAHVHRSRTDGNDTMKTTNAGMNFACICGVAVAALASASSALGSTWNMTFNGLGPARIVGVNYNNNRTWNAGSVTNFTSYWAGEMRWTNNQGRSFTTFCTQVKENIAFNQNVTYTQVAVEQVPDSPPAPGPMGAVKATILRDLYARFYHDVKSSGDATKNSAFQCLVWEITHENVNAASAANALGQLDLSKGAFQLSQAGNTNASVFAAANQMLAELGGSNKSLFLAFANDDNLRGLRHDTAQDQLLVVPVPAPVLLAAAGLLGVGVLRRRMQAAKA
jgi:hypothetical protein